MINKEDLKLSVYRLYNFTKKYLPGAIDDMFSSDKDILLGLIDRSEVIEKALEISCRDKALYKDKIKILELALDDVSNKLNIVMPKKNGIDWKEHALNQAMGYVNAEHILEEGKE